MDLITLAKKVKELRETQTLYFKYRHGTVLAKSKMLEAEIDKMVERILNPPVEQKELFS